MSFQSTLEDSNIIRLKRSSHKSFYNIPEAYKESFGSNFGTTSMHLPLDLNCLNILLQFYKYRLAHEVLYKYKATL